LDAEHSYPLFVYIFDKLKHKGLDWKYYFPRMGILSFQKEPTDTTISENYDPEKGMAEEIEKRQKQREIEEFQSKLDNAYEEEREEAKYKRPPLIIRAYAEVYGQFPEGWVH